MIQKGQRRKNKFPPFANKNKKQMKKQTNKTIPTLPPILPNCLGELDTVNDRSWPANQAGGRHHGGGGGGKFKQAVSH